MIAPSIVNEIKRLLAEGKHSQRGIARMIGVSRGTVGAIARGTRPDYELPRRQHKDLEESAGPPQRCRGCGGTVHMPCRLCHVRKLKEDSRIAALPARPSEAPRLELSAKHQRRYEEVCRRRTEEGRWHRRRQSGTRIHNEAG